MNDRTWNFNRGAHRVIEDERSGDKRSKRIVTIRIVPRFDGASVRPLVTDVWWTVNGKEGSAKFPYERSEKRHGRR
ncbi:MAG TPA: hypothetical protein VF628_13500 [Allosphingosinicella sp.]|jgi:hypothetical protein